jgi:hypothetical protein
MSQEILEALQNVHERMKQRLMANPEYCALLALEKSIASISEILAPLNTQIHGRDDDKDEAIESAIAETIATKVVPQPANPAQQRLPTAPFFPQHRVVGGQPVAAMR